MLPFRAIFYSLMFYVGWQLGMAQADWHKWIVGGMAAYMMGAVMRMMWV